MAKKRRKKTRAYAVMGGFILLFGVAVFFIVRAIAGGGNQEQDLLADNPPTVVNDGSVATPTPTLPPLAPLATTPTPAVDPASFTPEPSPVPDVPTPTPESKATPTPGSTIRKATSKEKKEAKDGYLTGDDINLRVGPSTDYKSLGKYKKNETLSIYAKDDDFYFVKMKKDGKTGFVATKYVKQSEASTKDAPSGTITGKVNASVVALRSGASKTDSAITELHSGDQVFIHYKEGDFYYVEVASNGKKGYAYASYISHSGSVPDK